MDEVKVIPEYSANGEVISVIFTGCQFGYPILAYSGLSLTLGMIPLLMLTTLPFPVSLES